MSYLLALIFLISGILFGKKVLFKTNKNYDLMLLALALVFFILGQKAEVFRLYNFVGNISIIVPPFILGVLIRRRFSKTLI
ncbi:hypothetical protein [Clostridium paridis]|uniref:Uncharacterized protein n=1 Tax=Clostridium paridis TaxID=2803863 RepID=A0A937FCC1_9CLOT|nr:hypothetical protein [Clostridium paridis]MBL4930668.1 hypothetical protein [Clostridium paridis]